MRYLANRCPLMLWVTAGTQSLVTVLMTRRLSYTLSPSFATSLSP